MLRHFGFVVCVIGAINIGNVVSFADDISQLRTALNLIATNSESDRECKSQLDDFIDGLEKRENWAVESNELWKNFISFDSTNLSFSVWHVGKSSNGNFARKQSKLWILHSLRELQIRSAKLENNSRSTLYGILSSKKRFWDTSTKWFDL